MYLLSLSREALPAPLCLPISTHAQEEKIGLVRYGRRQFIVVRRPETNLRQPRSKAATRARLSRRRGGQILGGGPAIIPDLNPSSLVNLRAGPERSG